MPGGDPRGESDLSCWKEKKMGFSLWNKIFNGEICRQAFADVEDGFYPKAQDLYAFFLIAYYSRSYMGIENRLYRYMFGIGVTGSDYISIPKFDVMMTEKQIWECLVRFIDKNRNRRSIRRSWMGFISIFWQTVSAAGRIICRQKIFPKALIIWWIPGDWKMSFQN